MNYLDKRAPQLATDSCFDAWKAYRGGGTSHEEQEALADLKAFFEAGGRTHFERIDHDGSEETLANRSDDMAVRDRCGYRVEKEGEGTVYYVLPEAFRREICRDHSPELMIKIARAHGALILGEEKKPHAEDKTDKDRRCQKKVRLPDYPRGKRVYALRPDLLP